MTEKDLDIAIEKCERIMEFDTRTLKNPVSENGFLFDSVYDLLKFLRRIQFETGAKDGDMDDTISRRALLDVVESVDWYHQNKNGEMVHGANSDEHQAWYKAEDIYKAIESVPTAQPGWIPCTTETMPKNKSNVLTVIYIPGRQAHIRSGWYEDGLFMNDNGDTWRATDKEVVGWMYQPKLPKPYREGGQE